ncbi:DUF4251 domain-containing protein [Mucilaginibacter gynuensis]|uniref:DUF4251 domain-containing protein n=1 Tax=Mucilaginibacter gynuensis TaxID=1302236 RepID=A0ABP8FMK0_9SPHI
MKTLIKVLFIGLVIGIMNPAAAQTTKKEKAAAKATEVKNKIDSGKYTFKATYVLPLAGGQRYLNADYDLKIGKDSLIAYLPYFGRAFSGAAITPSTDGGVKFTSTNFSYKVTPGKKGSWKVRADTKDTQNRDKITIDIFANGSATLMISSINRQPITYIGSIVTDN